MELPPFAHNASYTGRSLNFYMMHVRKSQILWLLFLLLMESSGVAQHVDSVELSDRVLLPKVGVVHNFTEKQAILVDDFIKKQMTVLGIPGASLAIIKNGEVIYSQVYGVANAGSGVPVTEKTLFETGSITKSVFAFVVMRLVERNVHCFINPNS